MIERLLPRHHRIIELALTGMSYQDIAVALGISVSTVRNVMRSPLVQDELARKRVAVNDPEVARTVMDRDAAQSQALTILGAAAAKAAEVQVSLLEDENPLIRLKASTTVLDRLFGGKDGRDKPTVINVSAEHINLLTVALKESRNGSQNQVRHHLEPAHDEETQPSPEGGQGDVSAEIRDASEVG